MLSIKTNKNNYKLTYIPLNIDSIITGETVNDDITIKTHGGHNLKTNDTIEFIRQDGETISYFKDYEVKNVINNNTFTVDGFGRFLINVNGYKPSFVRYSNNIEAINSGVTSYIQDNDAYNTTGSTNPRNTILYLNTDPYFIEISGSVLDSSISTNYANSLISVKIGKDVNVIDDFAFSNCLLLETVNIPNNVVHIGDYAFYECANLKNVYLGVNVEYIGKHAFYKIYGEDGVLSNIICEAKEPPTLGDSYVFRTSLQEEGEFAIPNLYVPSDVLNVYRGTYAKPITLTQTGGCIQEKYICLKTDEHIFVTNKDDIEIRRRYLWNIEQNVYDYYGALTMCDGDYYTFDNIFLIQNIENEYVVCKNITLDITATTIGYNPILLKNCLIGVDYNGKDDKYHIYIPYDENIGFASELEDRIGYTRFTSNNIRFLHNENNIMTYGCELQPGAHIDKVCGNIEVDISIGNNFEVNLHHDEQISNYVENIKNESINKIIDYERHQYTPMYYDGGIPDVENDVDITVDEYLNSHSDEIDNKLKKVNEIKFRLYFRTKDFTLYDDEGKIIETSGDTNNTDFIDFGTWQTDDNGYWNNYKLRSDRTRLDEVYRNFDVRGDLLGYLGFNDDDVYFQKDALKKSFLRLSFYDSPNRETQKLLYYSTIYFDTNVLSRKYINDLNAWRNNLDYTPRYNQLVFAYDIAKIFSREKASLLTAEMSCTDKYDNTSSSDGFYLHLFDKLVSGNTCTPIYMKAEFNNAKFGKTVPMIRPIFKKTNAAIPPTHQSFPREYMRDEKGSINGEIYNWVDIGMLLQDMYTKIYIKYDFNEHQFVWFLPQGGLSDTLTFDLFEPRITGYDYGSYDALNGNTMCYGTTDCTPNWFQGKFNDEHVWVTEGDRKTEEEWASSYDGCCLMTTATTLQGENILDGTKLFNKNTLKNVSRIWIDGMMVYSSNVYDEDNDEYKTVNLQLPDIPFSAQTYGGETFPWTCTTTQEVWSDESDEWVIDESIIPKKIHSVNYYFKTNKKDHVKLLNELYTGINGNEKTKEITETLCTTLKNSITSEPSETLPNGMFSNIQSLKCVRFISNCGKYFTTLGNGAFDNCQELIRVTVDDDSLDIIGKNCFAGCRSLKTADLSTVKIILREAFQGCFTLTKVNFGADESKTIKYIGCGSFGYTKIKHIEIPQSILRIGNSAFRRCYQLNEFVINGNSQSVTIGKRAFGDCAILKYNLVKDNNKKYNYVGGVPNIIQHFLSNRDKISFYDACRKRYVTLEFSSEKDRGKVMYHFKDKNYYDYLNKHQYKVYTFEDWYRYLF